MKLPKLKEVKAKLHRNFSDQIKSVTVSQVLSGKYYISILVETEHTAIPKEDGQSGLDLGIKDLCITSDGRKYENPKTLAKQEKKLKKLQRQLDHKEKRSKNYYKARKQIALCHEIISENQVIVTKNLQIKNMIKNHYSAKSIADISWYEFTRQL